MNTSIPTTFTTVPSLNDNRITTYDINPTLTVFPREIKAIEQIPGLWLLYDFITPTEELELVQHIDNDVATPWKHSSFNGHCNSKTFGVKTQFGLPHEQRLVRRNDKSKGEYDIPQYVQFVTQRLQQLLHLYPDLPTELRTFTPNDCNMNSYEKALKHSLRPHYDDRALSGPLLLNLSLIGTATMTYSKPVTTTDTGDNVAIRFPVHLPQRCLQLVTGPARWDFMHEIQSQDLSSARRVSITWRQSGGKKGVFENGNIAQQLLQKQIS